jgi:hypothetical protein
MATISQAPPPLIYQIHQPFFVAATNHLLSASGANVPDTFTVDALYDFSVNSMAVSAYDQNGSLFDLAVRSDLFEMEIKSNTSNQHFQNQAFDIRAFKDLVASGGFPGMYMPKGSVWQVSITHKPVAAAAPPVFPVLIKVQFFGSHRTAKTNPDYQRWLQENPQYRQ